MTTQSGWEYRAVGYDDPDAPDSDGTVREYTDWTTDREAAERALRGMRRDDPPFDDTWLERRAVTYGPPERLDV